MSKVLVVLELDGPGIARHCLPGITCAQQIAAAKSGEVHLLVLGASPQAAAAAIAQSGYGAHTVHVATDPAFEPFTAEAWADAIVGATRHLNADVIGGASSSSLRDALPRAAALLDAALASEIVSIVSGDTFRRPVCAGLALLDLQTRSPRVCFTARGSEFQPAVAGSAARLSVLDVGAVSTRGVEVLGVETSESSRPALTEAQVVVSGGRGMREAENFKMLEELTDLLGGALGASRAVTDAGMVPADLQVGQTGKIVAPDLYIAVGISGAIQHVAGIKGSRTIVAINKDSEAPIFQVADYGLVAKWEDALPDLIERIRAHKSAG
ncbi:MAG: electron transfer flavoprotein subunit alpha/FixB family protein [Nannocystaceae bacterium]